MAGEAKLADCEAVTQATGGPQPLPHDGLNARRGLAAMFQSVHSAEASN